MLISKKVATHINVFLRACCLSIMIAVTHNALDVGIGRYAMHKQEAYDMVEWHDATV